MIVVVVESPSKAKTINRYLGEEYNVFATHGHVRDLAKEDGSVEPEHDFAMSWRVDPKKKPHIDAIAEALINSNKLYLATDPDREGEAIAWHLKDILEQRKALNGIEVKRIVFHEITKDAIQEAITSPLDLNQELVDAYRARRALDRLYGYKLSPVLWRKLPRSRSAGRVQSVALRLICERESEIEVFQSDEFWTIDVTFATTAGEPFVASLTHVDGKKLGKLSLADKESSDNIVSQLSANKFSIGAVKRKQTKSHPAAPLTTSTLQQKAGGIGFSASRTMTVAQRLYEGLDIGGETVGLITYMRTDSVTLSQSALSSCRSFIKRDFGDAYLPDKARYYRNKSRNAQEAHEAIRPTDVFRTPQSVRKYLDNDQARLYELIWKQTIACQMASAVLDQMVVTIEAQDHSVELRATGSVVHFDGYFKISRDDVRDQSSNTNDQSVPGGDERDRRLPPMTEGQAATLTSILPEQHFTQPPARYSEASLVRKMEEVGIGRPSTYASIIKVLQDRNYVQLDKRRFIPEDQGRLVTAFLTNFFARYIEYDFTAELESQLDDISSGRDDWRRVLQDFWQQFSGSIAGTSDLSITQVLDALNDTLGRHFFPTEENGNSDKARVCPACKNGKLSLKLGKFGAFIGCSDYPDCRYTRQLTVETANSEIDEITADLASGPKLLGKDPTSCLDVTLRRGPYGIYVQLGEGEPADKKAKKKAVKPKRVSLPKDLSVASLELETALNLLALPRDIGLHPETGDMITAGIGRFGPYLKQGSAFVSLRDDDVLHIGLNRAVALISESKTRGKTSGRELGKHPDNNRPITQHSGRYGPYIKYGRITTTLPKEIAAEDVTLQQALELLATKANKAAKSKNPIKKKARGRSKRETAKASAVGGE